MAVGFPTKANWAAGDVLTASAQDDLAGTVNLLSNASAASGSQLVSNVAGTSFAYQATPSASNPILNSAMNVWQRGTSTACTSTSYSADRWQNYRGVAGATVSRQAAGDTTNLPFIQYCARMQRDSGNTSTSIMILGQSIETFNSVPFAGKTITLSFYARAGANYSATSNALTVNLNSGTGTDQNVVSGYTGTATPINTAPILTTTWQRFTATAAIASTTTEMGLQFYYIPVGTAGTNDYFEITGVQIDIGSVALPFRTYAGTYQGELAACQRYYSKSYAQGTTVPTNSTAGNVQLAPAFGTVANNSGFAHVQMPVVMRTQPSIAIYSFTSSTANVVTNNTGTDLAAGSGSVNYNQDRSFGVYNNSGALITPTNGAFIFHWAASAEL